MNEKDLVKISLIVSMAGIIIIYAFSRASTPEALTIGDLQALTLGDNVKVCGVITKTFTSEKGTFFIELSDPDDAGVNVSAVYFPDNAKALGISELGVNKGSQACVSGVLDEYEGSREIIGKDLELSGE